MTRLIKTALAMTTICAILLVPLIITIVCCDYPTGSSDSIIYDPVPDPVDTSVQSEPIFPLPSIEETEESTKVDTYTIIGGYSTAITNVIPDYYTYIYYLDGEVIYMTEYQYNDIMMIARMVFAEAGNQCFEGRLAVASVIMNRVTCTYYNWGDSVYEVLSAPRQFHAFNNSNYNQDPTPENIDIALRAYIGNTNLPEHVLFFCGMKNYDGWGTYPYYTTIQDHSFYSYFG